MPIAKNSVIAVTILRVKVFGEATVKSLGRMRVATGVDARGGYLVTTICPIIPSFSWGVQKYVYSPGTLKVY